ncbi:Prostaglandin F synthase [Durusdinium trenchii]|uniref:Prostaglandin F synthase n=1 Tax=Durusdinium trenchii TaxID=1381693 RepID=A0ABP0R7Z3_9DINO
MIALVLFQLTWVAHAQTDALVPGGFPGALPGIVPGLRKVLQAAPTEAPSLVPPPPPAPPNRALPSTKVDALASDAITTSSKPGMKISIDMTGFHMSAEEIRQSEDKLKQEAQNEARVQEEEIAHRHEAYQWLKQHGNNMDNSVCEAAGTFFNFKVLTQLVKMGGSVNKQMCGSDSGTPLQAAAYWGLSEGVKRIMRELGADPNLCNAKGLPPVYEACEHVNGPSNKDTILGLVEGGADLNMEVEGVSLVKLAMQKGSWAVARCLLRAGATWPFVFDTKLEVHGQAYNLPHVPLSMKDAHYHFCRAAETGNTTMIVSYIASGMDMDYGLCWTPSLTWYTTVLGHAAFHRQKEVVRLLTSWGSSSKKSVSCLKKRKQCRGNSCFNCYSACEAYHSKDETLESEKRAPDDELLHLLNC